MKYSRFLLLLLPVLFISCGTGRAEKAAEEYHEKLKAGKYDYICDNIIDPDQLAADGREAWMGLFDLIGSWGKIVSIEQESGFHTEYDNGITIVNLTYLFKFEDLETFERIALVDRGDGFKVLGVIYNPDKDKLDQSPA